MQTGLATLRTGHTIGESDRPTGEDTVRAIPVISLKSDPTDLSSEGTGPRSLAYEGPSLELAAGVASSLMSDGLLAGSRFSGASGDMEPAVAMAIGNGLGSMNSTSSSSSRIPLAPGGALLSRGDRRGNVKSDVLLSIVLSSRPVGVRTGGKRGDVALPAPWMGEGAAGRPIDSVFFISKGIIWFLPGISSPAHG